MAYETLAERYEDAPTEEELRINAFNADRSAISRQISEANNRTALLEAYTAIKQFQANYSQAYSTTELKQLLIERVKKLEAENRAEEIRLAQEAENLQTQLFPDPPEELQRISVQADQYLLQLYSGLGTNTTQNRLTISAAIKQATAGDGDRVAATALLRLLQNPSYSPYFHAGDKERISEASRSPIWKELDKQRNTSLQRVSKDRAAVMMEGLQLRNLHNVIEKGLKNLQ